MWQNCVDEDAQVTSDPVRTWFLTQVTIGSFLSVTGQLGMSRCGPLCKCHDPCRCTMPHVRECIGKHSSQHFGSHGVLWSQCCGHFSKSCCGCQSCVLFFNTSLSLPNYFPLNCRENNRLGVFLQPWHTLAITNTDSIIEVRKCWVTVDILDICEPVGVWRFVATDGVWRNCF